MKKITLDLPNEFLEQCKQDDIEPEIVLRGFIADLCGIINLAANPRKDGYASNGSDERDLARSYYERVGYPHWDR
ncbi:TPA: hypothetical protein ACRIDK_000658 [Legionella anisa]